MARECAEPGVPRLCSGLHSLPYNTTVVSQEGSGQPRFLTEGHFNGKPFLYYDSENGQAEPWGPWAETHLGAENDSGLHSFQEKLGCEIQEDSYLRGFWNYSYDGEPFFSYDLETQAWTVFRPSAQTLAMTTKKTWDALPMTHEPSQPPPLPSKTPSSYQPKGLGFHGPKQPVSNMELEGWA
ncbi:PREDICTED: MHC class I polypeptide-related sequence B-like [Chrysochloris asiatica]|uniref:MHC class I polypeptide-related sequence B-like n=1 Tax=Chrysochloris asiatica TaxID=185453 RepID=A0A9B0U4C8_CHRAS|nr:PREDICTED: MHC class I polypeptide-related sequence B-like [Chrysochloris asiatica]